MKPISKHTKFFFSCRNRYFITIARFIIAGAVLVLGCNASDPFIAFAKDRNTAPVLISGYIQGQASGAKNFRVLQLTDIHTHSGDIGSEENNQKFYHNLRLLVNTTKPDLIIVTGDAIADNGDHTGNKDMLLFISTISAMNTPWTLALGNHDQADDIEQMERDLSNASFSYFKSMNKQSAGIGNHYIDLVDKKGSKLWRFYILNSGVSGLNKQVLDWFAEKVGSSGSTGDTKMTPPSFAFVHIPLIEFKSVWDIGGASGMKGEDVCYEQTLPMAIDYFERANVDNDFRAIFVGHDHANDYHGVWKDIQLVYGRVSGYNGYGNYPRGAKLIEIDLEKKTFSHRTVLL
ncbi:MAG: metallophosphoesterase [Oligoflexia bacterium]|nr:metallophosphoesterase [Oligoflexia bacterium]